MFKVKEEKLIYDHPPHDGQAYTDQMDNIYTRFAKAYDGFIAVFPLWKKWLKTVLPYVQGDKLLDVSFGPGFLFCCYPKSMTLHGLDYNETMVTRMREKATKQGIEVDIVKGNVEAMPYADKSFDTVVNTMAFSGYPDGAKAISEMLRVLRDDGVLLLLDYDYPDNRNVFGYGMVRLISKSGDIIKDIGKQLKAAPCTYERKVVGCFGSVQLFIIKKQNWKQDR